LSFDETETFFVPATPTRYSLKSLATSLRIQMSLLLAAFSFTQTGAHVGGPFA